MPYPNEHAARIAEPSEFLQDSFRRKEIAPGISLILGKKTGSDSMETQAVRFDKTKFDPAQAQKWLKDNNYSPVSFEPAVENAEMKDQDPSACAKAPGEPQKGPLMPQVGPEVEKTSNPPVSGPPVGSGKAPKKDDELMPKTMTLQDVEIFRTGTWNGDKYTEADFDEMVKAHEEIGAKIKPYMKLGHSKKQGLLQSDGLPAAGWVTRLRRVGDRLKADIEAIPSKIAQLIGAKAYGRFSPEIYWNYPSEENNGKKYPRVLRAVALLGGDTPACTTMDDFISLYGLDLEAVKAYVIDTNEDNKPKTYEMAEKTEEEVRKMDHEKVLAEQTEKLQQYEKDLSEKDAALKTATDELAELKAYRETAEKEKNALVRAKFDSDVEDFIKANPTRITPAQAHLYRALCLKDVGEKTYSYKDGEKEIKVEKTCLELARDLVAGLPEFVSYTESTTGTPPVKGDKDSRLDERAREYQKAHPGTAYATALRAVSKEE